MENWDDLPFSPLEPGDRVLVVLGSQIGRTGVIDYAERDRYYYIDFDEPRGYHGLKEPQFHRAQLFAYEHAWSCT